VRTTAAFVVVVYVTMKRLMTVGDHPQSVRARSMIRVDLGLLVAHGMIAFVLVDFKRLILVVEAYFGQICQLTNKKMLSAVMVR